MSWVFLAFGLLIGAISCQGFLDIPKDDLCRAEPNLEMCRGMQAEARSSSEKADDPFADIATRAPDTEAFAPSHRSSLRKKGPPKTWREYYERRNQHDQDREYRQRYHSGFYNLYPGLYPKDKNFCETMKPNFAFTCQPGKSLRIDLVEFCKDYSIFCGLPNFHRLPGPREGPSPDGRPGGRVGVNLGVGFSIGTVPGLEVDAGAGVDVGPIPGMGENVGVGVGLNLGLLGSKSPEAYRRGMDNPNDPGGGLVGINGGVGVQAPGVPGGVGVNSGVGVGR
ncbi:unnamed protein product, partial [Mesorhabditis spiculigera]